MLTLFGTSQSLLRRRSAPQFPSYRHTRRQRREFVAPGRHLPRAEGEAVPAPPASKHKSVINIFLGGGPPHQDMWDIKTEAPVEIRGEFKPIATNVPGIQIGEVFPKLAAHDGQVRRHPLRGRRQRRPRRVAVHDGLGPQSLASIGGRPSIGAVVASCKATSIRRCRRSSAWPTAPSTSPGPIRQAGFLGSAYAAFKPDGPGMADMKLNGITLDQLDDRKTLLTSFDNLRRDLDANGASRCDAIPTAPWTC